MKKTYEQALKELKPGETLYTYALYTDGGYDNDTASWFYDLDEAIEAGRNAILEDGADPDCIAIMKFEDSSIPGASNECQWDYYINFDEEGRAWTDHWSAREEMGFAQ